ncbi:hypothetical protein AgCh_039981 [Apium graveolens]
MDILENQCLENGFSHPSETKGKVITCKAAVAWGPGLPLVVEEIWVEPPREMEVRIKILFTSICHTALSAWKGENEAQRVYPRIFGHEASGVNALKSVMVNDGKTRFFTKEGRPIYHFLNTSTFSEYSVIDSGCVVKIHPKASLKSMTLLSCCLSTGLGAVWNTANVEAGSSIAVFGLGSVGLAVVEGARTRGVSKIIGVDINPDKFIKGKAMGMTDSINPGELNMSVHEKIREISGGGVDYSFECAGNVDVLREAFLSTHDAWGLTVVLGVHPTPRLLPLHPMELLDGRSIIGSVFGGFKGKSQLPHIVQECMTGAIKVDGFITHELPFGKINEAFQLLIDGKSLRCVLHL